MPVREELKQRWNNLSSILKNKGLDAALFVGSGSVGPLSYGCFRYFTDWRVYYYLQAFLMKKDGEPYVFAGSPLHRQGLSERGFTNIVIGPDLLGNILKELGGVRRIGTCLNTLPADWYEAIRKACPHAEFVELSEDVYELRAVHSDYETACIRQCAQIADTAYDALCRLVKPGMRMADLHAELDRLLKANGAEDVFTLLCNGRFRYCTGGRENGLPPLKAFGFPDDRIIKPGDNIGMEISPRYGGYWTQMARTVCVGEPDPDLVRAHESQLKVLEYAAAHLVPGNTLGNFLGDLWALSKEMGYEPKLPFGHILGLDLDEGGRGSLESNFYFRENTTVVLHPTLTLGGMNYGIFWGDTYLAADKGAERINSAACELLIL